MKKIQRKDVGSMNENERWRSMEEASWSAMHVGERFYFSRPNYKEE